MKKLHQSEKEYIIENYPLFGLKAVAQKLNRSLGAVSKFAKDNNLIINKNKLPASEIPDFLVNLDFYSRFEDSLNPELVYWIGFLWADGTISNNSIRIEIVEDDGKELETTFSEVFPFSISHRCRQGRRPQMAFSVSDKKVCDLLISLGKYPKSVENHQKIYKYINNDELWVYFLRGLIDGDGNFYINEREKYAQFTLASSFDQDWSFLLENLKKFNPNITQTSKNSGKSSVLRITGRENILNFIEYLKYSTVDIGLSRKRLKALDIIEFYAKNPPKGYKHVIQFDKNMNFIKEYNSVSEASELTKIGKSSIRNCLANISKSAGGYIWLYKN